MKRRGFTYTGTIFSFLILLSSCVILLKAAGAASDTEKIARIKKELAVLNLNAVEQVEQSLKNGEQIELNDYGTNQTQVKITADESSAVYLVEVKSEKNGISVKSSAVLYSFGEG